MKEKILNKINQIKREDINCMLVAILCLSGLISLVINVNNIIPLIIITVFITLEAINYKETYKKIKKGKVDINIFSIIFVCIVICVFLISILCNGIKNTILERLIYFFCFILMPYMCCRHKINAKKVINSVLIVSAIISVPLFFINFSIYDGGNRMAISYYMLPTFIALIMCFFIDENKKIKWMLLKIILFGIIFFPYLHFLVVYASRGILLAVFVCIVFCSIIKKNIKQRLIALAIIIVISTLILAFIGPILKGINSLITNLNIKVEFISKNASLYENNMLDNGRNKVYMRAIDGIKQHPLIGNGIGDYAEKYITYPHNLLLQAWYEGGIIFFVVMLFIFLYSIYILVLDKNTEKNEIYLLIFFFSISITRLMISYEFWKEISFGMYLFFVFYILKNNWNKRRTKNNGNSYNPNI